MSTHEALLAKLVSFDTTSSKPNRACIDFIRDYLDRHKIRSTIIESDNPSKACLWATIGPEENPGIVLSGHSDVVPTEGQNWSSEPFTLTEREGKFFARGACDMKGFIACALAAAGEVQKDRLKRPIHLAFTYNEEADMEGAARLTNYLKTRGIKPQWVWVGEPTGLRIADAHKGVAAFDTKITGKPGHSSRPDEGLNAIELGAQFIDIVRRVAAEKKNHPVKNSRFVPPYSTFNLGIIKGGTAENIIAEHCEILWQTREHPGDNLDAALAEIDRLVEKEIGPRIQPFAPQAKMSTCVCFRIPPLLPAPKNPGQETLAHLTGQNETEAMSFATEGGFFQKMGCPVVICGPGYIREAHQPDEYVEKAQLDACLDLIRRTAAHI